MKINQKGLDLIKSFEGCHLEAYLCPAGVPTIGWGTTKINGKPVKLGTVITQEQAEEYLRKDVEKYEKAVMKYDDTYHFTENQFSALVSFAYNIGSIDQLTAKGTRTIEQISNKILAYNKAGGKVLKGLVRRREAEKALFDSDEVTETVKKDNPKGNPYKMPSKNVKLGSVGNSARWLQWELNRNGASLKIDGVFGKKTLEAVKKYQKTNNLVVDGIVGKKTKARLTL